MPLTIESGGEKSTLTFDQTQPLPAGESFRSAGIVKLSATGETRITVSNAGTKGFVILDAVQLLEVTE